MNENSKKESQNTKASSSHESLIASTSSATRTGDKATDQGYEMIYTSLETLGSEVSNFTLRMDQITKTTVNMVGLISLMTSIADSELKESDSTDTDRKRAQEEGNRLNFRKKTNESDDESFHDDSLILL